MRKIGLAVVAAALLLATPVLAQSGLRNTPAGFCALSSVASATKITTSNCVFGSFTGVIAGNVLTASSVTGSLLTGQLVIGAGVTGGTYITAQTGGTDGGAGIYTLSNSLTVGSESMTTAGVPQASDYAVVCAYTQAVNWRDDKTAPTSAVGGGQGLVPVAPAPACIGYNGTLTNLQFIQQAATAVVGITFYQ